MHIVSEFHIALREVEAWMYMTLTCHSNNKVSFINLFFSSLILGIKSIFFMAVDTFALK